jgi:hypothetical protein
MLATACLYDLRLCIRDFTKRQVFFDIIIGVLQISRKSHNDDSNALKNLTE